MCYFLRYRRSTSRNTDAAAITLAAVQSMKTHKDWESNHVDVGAPEINDKDWAPTFEAIDEWLRGCLWTTLLFGKSSLPSCTRMSVGPMSDLLNALTMDVWPTELSKTTTSAQTTQITRPMKPRPSSRTLVTTVRSVAGTLSGMSTCTRTNTILHSLVQHGYAGIDERSKVRHLLDRSRLTSWILLWDRYGPHLRYIPTSTTASCCSRTLSTTRRLPPHGPPLLRPLGLKGNPTILTKTMPNPTCQWMTVTTWVRNTPSYPRPRNLASNLSAKGVATNQVTWATTSQVIWVTRAGLGQHRSQQMTIGQQCALSRHCQGSSPKVNRKMTTSQVKPIPMWVPTTHQTGPTRRYKGESDYEVPGDKGWWFEPSRSLGLSGPWDLLGPKPTFFSREQNSTVTQIHPWLGVTLPY